MKRKITMLLLVLCLVLGLGTVAVAAQEETGCSHDILSIAPSAAENCQYGGVCTWYWGIDGSGGHHKYCGKCGNTKDYEAHGFITAGGVKYCGSCGWQAACSASPYGAHEMTAGSAPFCLYCGQKVY